MSCNISVPIEDIAESVAQMLRQQFIEKDGGTGTGNTLTDTVLRGGLTFDATAKQAICDAIERCVASQIAESQAEQDADIDDKINAGDDRLEDKINGFEDRIDAGRIVGVTREDDTVTVKLANGNEFPFSITDSSSGGDRPVQFAPSADGENVEITLADGSVLDMTRQEFADWLAGDESPIATDEELQELADAIANDTGDLQSQIDTLNDKFNAINHDQATLSTVGDKLRVTNEDGTFSEVPLTDLIPLSDDAGQLIEMREDGIYYGIEAKKEVAVLYVDYEDGDDSNDGTEDSPLKTIDEAFRRAPENKNSTILLRAVDSLDRPMIHEMNVNEFTKGGATRYIASYGQPYFPDGLEQALKSKGGYLTTSLSEEHIRPIVKPVWQEVFDGTKQIAPYFGGDKISKIQFGGVRLDLSRVIGGLGILSNQFIRGNGNFVFSGCEIAVYDNSTPSTLFYFPGSGSSPEIELSRTKWIDGDTGEEIIPDKTLVNLSGSTGTIICNDDVWGPTRQSALDAVKAEYPEFADITITPFSGNSRDVFSTPGKVSGVVRSSLGVPLNLTSNVEIPQ